MKRQYLVNKATGQKYRVNGCMSSSNMAERSALGQSFMSLIYSGVGRLPPKVDLRPRMTKVENQSAAGSW